jgi:hypothetical protein
MKLDYEEKMELILKRYRANVLSKVENMNVWARKELLGKDDIKA